MAKSFKDQNPIDKLAEQKPKNKGGRPRKEPCKNINIAVPIRLLDKWSELKDALGGNQTAYIVRLLEKDMQENYDNYKQILEIQKKIGI